MLVINPLIEVLLLVLNLFQWSLVIYILISLLVQFGVVNPYHSIINLVQNSLSQIHEPILNVLRRYIPIFGNLDLTPLIVFVVIHFISGILRNSII
jgi:YggT family protein